MGVEGSVCTRLTNHPRASLLAIEDQKSTPDIIAMETKSLTPRQPPGSKEDDRGKTNMVDKRCYRGLSDFSCLWGGLPPSHPPQLFIASPLPPPVSLTSLFFHRSYFNSSALFFSFLLHKFGKKKSLLSSGLSSYPSFSIK